MHTLAKGNAWRHLVAVMLQPWGRVTKRGIGDAGDDLTLELARVTLSIEAKNERRVDLAGWINQAERQCPPGQLPVVIAHRQGKASAESGYVVVSGATFVRLLQTLDV